MLHKEHHIQCQIITYLRFKKIYCWATPNGERRDARSGKRLKMEGVLPGVSDITALIGNKTYYIEVKTEKGIQSKSQKEFQRNVEAQGHDYLIFRSLEDAINFADSVLKGSFS